MKRAGASPILEVARAIFGDAAPAGIWFQLSLSSVETRRNGRARYQVSVGVDSRSAQSFKLAAYDLEDMTMERPPHPK